MLEKPNRSSCTCTCESTTLAQHKHRDLACPRTLHRLRVQSLGAGRSVEGRAEGRGGVGVQGQGDALGDGAIAQHRELHLSEIHKPQAVDTRHGRHTVTQARKDSYFLPNWHCQQSTTPVTGSPTRKKNDTTASLVRDRTHQLHQTRRQKEVLLGLLVCSATKDQGLHASQRCHFTRHIQGRHIMGK